MEIKVLNRSKFELPSYATAHSAGLDLRANIEEEITLKPLERRLIPTGIHIELPQGYEAQVRARSGLAIKHGIGIVNSPGTIDSDYRGEIMVILVNLSNNPFTIEPGERVAQMVVSKYEQVTLREVDSLKESQRGSGGFGSTGKS